MVKSVNHISFTVSNLERSVEFYRNLLGLEVVDVSERDRGFSERVTGIKNAQLKIAYLNAGNCSVELVQYLFPKGNKVDTETCNVGSAHVCFNVNNFLELTEKLRKGNINFTGSPCIIPIGPNKARMVLYFKDPDDNNIEIISTEIADERHYELFGG